MNTNLSWHQKLFLFTLYLSWILYVLSLVAYFGYNLKGLALIVDQILKIYISIILMYKFNPFFGNRKCSEFDKRLVWHGSFFLLLSTILTSSLFLVYGLVKNKIHKTL
tara:strand:+ start:134 stop:457 length:324 start_codon:yes stop_codon:yes gene_type:complete